MMICNISTFSYNGGPTWPPLQHGSIGSIKGRCLFDTCEKTNSANFSVRSFHTPITSENPLGPPVWVFCKDASSKYSETDTHIDQNVYSNPYSQAVYTPGGCRLQRAWRMSIATGKRESRPYQFRWSRRTTFPISDVGNCVSHVLTQVPRLTMYNLRHQ